MIQAYRLENKNYSQNGDMVLVPTRAIVHLFLLEIPTCLLKINLDPAHVHIFLSLGHSTVEWINNETERRRN